MTLGERLSVGGDFSWLSAEMKIGEDVLIK